MSIQGQVIIGEGTPLAVGGERSNVATEQAIAQTRADMNVEGKIIYPKGIYCDFIHVKEQFRVGDQVLIGNGDILANMIDVDELSAISADVGTLNAGVIDLSGTLIIRTDSSGARLELSGDGLVVLDASANVKTTVDSNGIEIRNANGSNPTNPEKLSFANYAGTEQGFICYDNTFGLIWINADNNLATQSAGDTTISATGDVVVQGDTVSITGIDGKVEIVSQSSSDVIITSAADIDLDPAGYLLVGGTTLVAGDVWAYNIDYAETPWEPTVTGSGTLNLTVTAYDCAYHIIGKLVFFRVKITFTVNSGSGTDIRFTVPHTTSDFLTAAAMVSFNGTTTAGGACLPYNSTTLQVRRYDANTGWTSTGNIATAQGFYVIA